MSGLIQYFKREFQLHMLGLEHPRPSDFYLSVWQSNRSATPLLIWRTLLFLASLCIVLTSFIIYVVSDISFGYWFIYLTHWGLTSITLVTGFAVAVSARCFFYGPLSADFCLPWYVKTYWVLFNIAVPLAFLITVFYWTLLYEAGIEEELDPVLDVFVHGVNSVLVFLLLASSAHSVRVVHMLHPLVFGLIYVVFSIVYHLAGGTDTKGNPWIYPVVNWANAGTTTLVIAVTGLLMVSLHFLTLVLIAIRDAAAHRILRPSVTVHIDEDLPLRTAQNIS